MSRSNPRAEDVIAHVDRSWGGGCVRCAAHLIGHDAVLGLMLGFGDEPRCIACLAAEHGRQRLAFLEGAYRNVRRLACYRAGWRHADRRLAAEGDWPEERIPSHLRMPLDEDDEERDESAPVDSHDGASSSPLPSFESALAASEPSERWDAGDRGCGELALELKLRVRRLPAGERILLQTTDAGAPADIPAWCRLTGNMLVAAAPPRYLIESRTPTT